MVTIFLEEGSYSLLSEMRPPPDRQQYFVPCLESYTNRFYDQHRVSVESLRAILLLLVG